MTSMVFRTVLQTDYRYLHLIYPAAYLCAATKLQRLFNNQLGI